MNTDEMLAGRDLDALVAEKVMELPQCICEYRSGVTQGITSFVECLNCGSDIAIEYSIDISAAWQVVAKVKELHNVCFALEDFQFDGKHWQALFKGEFDKNKGKWTRLDYAWGDTPELAICRAALKVVQEQKE